MIHDYALILYAKYDQQVRIHTCKFTIL